MSLLKPIHPIHSQPMKPIRFIPFPIVTALMVAALLGTALTLSGCGGDAQSKPNLEPAVRPVKMYTVRAEGEAPFREYPGTIEASETATLAFEMPGRVVDLPVREGETVPEGQLLARLDDENVRSRLEAARANRNAAMSAYKRAKRLYEREIVSLQQLEARRRDAEVAQSEVQTAREALADTRLTAPFAGEVARTHVEINETIGAQKPAVTLHDVSRIEVVIDVPEQDQLRRTLREAPLYVSLSMQSGRRFPAQIKEIATAADPVTRTFEATLVFDPPANTDIRPGMTARVQVGASEAPADAPLVIPASAVFSDETGTPTVWHVDSSMQVTRRTVDVGPLRDSMVTIRSGLTPGERIAATGVHQLTDGQTVRPFSL